jgi:hypothetical protein
MKGKHMKITKYVLALFLTLAGLGSTVARAQTTVVSTVPFDFVIGNKTLPAGQYSVSRISNHSLDGPLLIRSADLKVAAVFFPTTRASVTEDHEATLEFTHHGDKYFLTGIVDAQEVYTLALSLPPERPVDANATMSVSTP